MIEKKRNLFDNDNESISCLNCVENEGKVKWRQFYLDLKDLFNDVNTMKKLDKRNNLILVRVKCMINKLEDDIDQDEDDGTLLNVYLIKLYEWLFEMYVEFEQFDLANLIAKQKLLSSYKFFLPRNHPSIGLLLLKIVKLMNNGDECKKSISYLKEANDVLKVCFKENSQIFNVINELKAVCL
ncbi:unnamed protein product [Brachionus calyciflorus]|uniref:Uncharacterized protein n=1 Tax=Brachionus calyciflorus TaxID=104777 RepID=A0A814G7I2_9BILA|nr:unnamed protein product [Brachionus calyciflorus]